MTTTTVYARTHPAGDVVTQYDATANDSNKEFTVPTGKRWLLMHLEARLTATATAGNRNVEIQIKDGSGNVLFQSEYLTLAASQVGRVTLVKGAARATGVSIWGDTTSKANIFSLPDLYLDAGFSVKMWDISAIDAAADDLISVLQYIEVDV